MSVTLAQLRDWFPATHDAVLFDNASDIACPLPVARALTSYLDSAVRVPRMQRRQALVEEALERLERVLGAPRRNLAFCSSTTAGLLFLARSLPLAAGSVVLIPANDYPATWQPWLAQRDNGVRVELLDATPYPAGGVPTERIATELRRTEVKVLCLSSVSWLGYRYPLDEIAKLCLAQGIVLAVDGSQSTGALNEVLGGGGISFLSTSFSKWAFAPEGIACIYCSEELRARLSPLFTGFASVVVNEEHLLDHRLLFPSAPQPVGIEEPPPLLLAGLIAGLDLVMEIGLHVIKNQILYLAEQAAERIAKRGFLIANHPDPRFRSGIVCFSHADPQRNRAIHRTLAEQRIYVSLREGLLRVSVHGYNTESDLARLDAALAAVDATQ